MMNNSSRNKFQEFKCHLNVLSLNIKYGKLSQAQCYSNIIKLNVAN